MTKGRNKTLIKNRDESLLRRYYYWTEVQRLRFDDALKILSNEEFFISEDRIMAIIRENCRKLKDVKVELVPRIRKPKITLKDLSIFSEE